VLLTWIAELADEPLLLDRADSAAEARANTWSLGADPEDRAAVTAEQVVLAFEEVTAAFSARIAATYYVWHDVQAGALKCSASSLAPDALPFGAAYQTTGELAPIVEAFLADRTPGSVAMSELRELDDTAAVSSTPPFLVWVRRLEPANRAPGA
jgi:hypothetical protein